MADEREVQNVKWEKYSSVGEVIPGTRLITFKVPLNENLCRKYEDDSLWFTPDTLLETTVERGIDIGLVIDLTFTTRYYHFTRFTSRGVKYEKIFVPGHEIPDDEIVDRFFTVIDTFLEDNKDNEKVIGIHCTHGINRTGYVVCRYMIERLGIQPGEAIEAYGKARGYPIERENYLEDLKLRPRKPDGENHNSSDKSNCDKPHSVKFSSAQNDDWRNNKRRNNYQAYQNRFHHSYRTRGDGNYFPYDGNQYQWERNHSHHDGSRHSGVNPRRQENGDYCGANHFRPHEPGAPGWSNSTYYDRQSGYRDYPPQRHRGHSYVNRSFNDYQSGGRHNHSANNKGYSSQRGNQSSRNSYKWSKNDNSESSEVHVGASWEER